VVVVKLSILLDAGLSKFGKPLDVNPFFPHHSPGTVRIRPSIADGTLQSISGEFISAPDLKFQISEVHPALASPLL
jgi:hypothetical protein